MIFFGWVIGALCVSHSANPDQVKPEPEQLPPTILLTNISAVRALSVAEAERGYPVQVSGVVTYADPPPWRSCFVQDETGGIWVNSEADQPIVPHGMRVKVTAKSAPGSFAPILEKARLEVLGPGSEPPAQKVTFDDLLTGQYDSRWIELRAMVRSAVVKESTMVLVLASRTTSLVAYVFGIDTNSLPSALNGAYVRVQGVCGTEFNQRRQFVHVHLMVPTFAHLKVEQAGTADPFSLPVSRVRDLFCFQPQNGSDGRFHVTGVVTLHLPGELLVIQDGEDGLIARTHQEDRLIPGDRVDVVGFPIAGGYSPQLTEAEYRRRDSGVIPEAIPVTAEQITENDFEKAVFDARFVRISARLLSHRVEPREEALLLAIGEIDFKAVLRKAALGPGEKQGEAWASLRPGSLLEVTGVCVQQLDDHHMIESFEILLHSPRAVRVLAQTSWWTAPRLLGATGGMSLGMMAVLAWVFTLRSQVHAQTEQLSLSENRFRTLVTATSHIVWTCNATGEAVGPVPSWQRFTGQTDEEVLGMGWSNALHPDDVEATFEIWRRAMADKSNFIREARLKRHDGVYRVLSSVGVPLLDEAGNIREWIGTCIDITERKEAEEALRESEERYRDLFENANDLIQSVTPDGRFLYVNSAWLKAMGYSRDELKDLTVFDILDPSCREKCCGIFQRIISGAKVENIQSIFVGKQGQRIFVEGSANCRFQNGKPTATRSIFRDITERKRAAEELAIRSSLLAIDAEVGAALAREQELRVALQHSAESIVRHLDATLARIWIYNSAGQTFELQASAGLDMSNEAAAPLVNFKLAFLAQEKRPYLNNSLLTDSRESEQEWVRREGLVSFAGYPAMVEEQVLGVMAFYSQHPVSGLILEGLGSVAGLVGLGIRRKQAEERFHEAQIELVEASREAGMAMVATNVLHNVGNALNSLSVSAHELGAKIGRVTPPSLLRVAQLLSEHEHNWEEFLLKDPRGRALPNYLTTLAGHLAEPQAELIKEFASFEKHLEHICGIVRLQQEYARSAQILEPVCLGELIEDALQFNAAAFARQGVDVVRQITPAPVLRLNKHMILQILVNLFKNAEHALAGKEAPRRLTIRLHLNGRNTVEISVADNGIGIPPENRSRIFQYGFTTRKGGHGFGLHSCVLAAQSMGGILTAHSDGPGQGAVFTLELPCGGAEESQ